MGVETMVQPVAVTGSHPSTLRWVGALMVKETCRRLGSTGCGFVVESRACSETYNGGCEPCRVLRPEYSSFKSKSCYTVIHEISKRVLQKCRSLAVDVKQRWPERSKCACFV